MQDVAAKYIVIVDEIKSEDDLPVPLRENRHLNLLQIRIDNKPSCRKY